jgi:hypothetical protein
VDIPSYARTADGECLELLERGSPLAIEEERPSQIVIDERKGRVDLEHTPGIVPSLRVQTRAELSVRQGASEIERQGVGLKGGFQQLQRFV